jgi:hypothetical protein
MTIVRQTAAPLLLVLACAACGAGKDPLADSSVASASSAPATSNPPSPDRGPTATPTPIPKTSASKRAQTTLPRGGRELFPRYRLVGYAGVTGASTLGRLGTGPLHQRVAEIERRAKPYAAGRDLARR